MTPTEIAALEGGDVCDEAVYRTLGWTAFEDDALLNRHYGIAPGETYRSYVPQVSTEPAAMHRLICHGLTLTPPIAIAVIPPWRNSPQWTALDMTDPDNSSTAKADTGPLAVAYCWLLAWAAREER